SRPLPNSLIASWAKPGTLLVNAWLAPSRRTASPPASASSIGQAGGGSRQIKQRGHLKLENQLVVLIEHPPCPSDNAQVLARCGRPDGRGRGSEAERITWPDGVRPAQIGQARRAKRFGVVQGCVSHHAHGKAASQPAAANQPFPAAMLSLLDN